MMAKDGAEAMVLLQEQIPDLMLLDIEMPHMDGFEVLSKVRLSEALRHLPVIMITSRTGDKHRERALSLGANLYLGKPYQESVLLGHINALLGRATGRVAD
jgi:chemosensory pili system protein ChpA (sensor histidine kinase/response regulator)